MVLILHHALILTTLAGLMAGLINSTLGYGNLLTFMVLTSVLGVPPLGAHLANQVAAPASFATAAWVSRRAHTATAAMVLMGCLGTALGGLALVVIPGGWVATAAPWGVLAGTVLLVSVPVMRMWTVRWRLPGLAVAGLWGGTVGAGVGSFVMCCVDGPTAASTRNVICLPMGVCVALPLVLLSPGRINWTLVAGLSAGMLIGGFVGSVLLSWLPRRQQVTDRLREAMATIGVGAFALLWTGSLATAGLATGAAIVVWIIVLGVRHALSSSQPRIVKHHVSPT